MPDAQQIDLFGVRLNQHGRITAFPTMARNTDPETSHEAAVRIEGRITELQAQVLAAFDHPMTAKECEQLPQFNFAGASTIRKRIVELSHKPYFKLVKTGVRRDGCAEYRRAQ